MSNTIASAEVLLPVTADSHYSDSIDVNNLFMFPEKKEKILALCSRFKIVPTDITVGTIKFRREDSPAVIEMLKQIDVKPLLTQEASISSMRRLSNNLGINMGDSGGATLSLRTRDGTVNIGTSIQIQNIDAADVERIVNVVKSALSSFNSPLSVSSYMGDGGEKKLVLENSTLKKLREAVSTALAASEIFKEYAIYMDNISQPAGIETNQTYANAMVINFPNGKYVKIPIAGSKEEIPLCVTCGNVWEGPDPKLLPVRAGKIAFTIVDASPDIVEFTVACNGKNLSEKYVFTRNQFENLLNIYQLERSKTSAFNVQQNRTRHDVEKQAELRQLQDNKNPEGKNNPQKQERLNLEKESEFSPLPDKTRIGDKISSEKPTFAPTVTKVDYVSTAASITRSLGIW